MAVQNKRNHPSLNEWMKKPAVNDTQCASAPAKQVHRLATALRCYIIQMNPKSCEQIFKKKNYSPNIIQSDPDTKTNASMSFSLSQRSPVQERLKTAASTAASRRQSGRLKRGGATIYLRRTTVGELGRGWRCQAGFTVERNVLTEETDPDGLLEHPSSCVFHLHLVGCCAMADTPAEMRRFIGRTEDAIDAKVTGVEMSILDANGLTKSFNYHIYCSVKCCNLVEFHLRSHVINLGI